jgi:hypothetical protein
VVANIPEREAGVEAALAPSSGALPVVGMALSSPGEAADEL